MENDDLRISVAEAKGRIDAGKAIVLDVVSSGSWPGLSRAIAGAIRINPDDIEKYYKQLPKEKQIIAYCT